MSEATSYVFDLKRLQRERAGERQEKALPSEQREGAHWPRVCALGRPPRLTFSKRDITGSEEALACEVSAECKPGEDWGGHAKLALSPQHADSVTGGFPERYGPCQCKWGEAGLKGFQTTPLKKQKRKSFLKTVHRVKSCTISGITI